MFRFLANNPHHPYARLLVIILGLVIILYSLLRFLTFSSMNNSLSLNHDLMQSFEIARQGYPELDHIKIRVVFHDMGDRYFGNALPLVPWVFLGPEKRRYVINVDTFKTNGMNAIDHAPTDAQIGFFAHELAHIYEYHTADRLHLTWLGIEYMVRSGRTQHEHFADEEAIRRGFGPEVLAKTQYIWTEIQHDEASKRMREKFYLGVEEIRGKVE